MAHGALGRLDYNSHQRRQKASLCRSVSTCAARLHWRSTQNCVQETRLPELAKRSTLPATCSPCAPLPRLSRETTLRCCAFDEERTRRFHDWLGFTRGQCMRDALSICCEPGLPLQRRGLAQENGQERDTPCNRFQGQRQKCHGDRWTKA